MTLAGDVHAPSPLCRASERLSASMRSMTLPERTALWTPPVSARPNGRIMDGILSKLTGSWSPRRLRQEASTSGSAFPEISLWCHSSQRSQSTSASRWAVVRIAAAFSMSPSRAVPLTATLRQTLHELTRPIDTEAPVLPQRDPLVLTRAFTRLAARREIENLTFHDLRRDAASTLAMAGVPLRTISEILGHRDLRMTARNAHLSPQHLRDAMRALDGPPAAPGSAEAATGS